MHKINVAIIGLGHLGTKHLKVYSELKDKVNLIALCDLKEDSAKHLASQHHIKFTTDYRELSGQVDAVNICVPTQTHFEVASFFLKHNVHTFVEKPMTLTIKEADTLIELAAKCRLKLQVGHVERFNSAFHSAKNFIHNPLFIECHRLNHFPNRSLDIGVVMDLMIHDIDIILGLVPSPIKNIHAVGAHVLTPLEDIANARIIFENGCVCNLTASRISDEVVRKIRIFCPHTYISLDYVKQEAFLYQKDHNNISKTSIPIEKEEPLKKELESFVDCIVNDQKPVVCGIEAREALRVALKIGKQIRDEKTK